MKSPVGVGKAHGLSFKCTHMGQSPKVLLLAYIPSFGYMYYVSKFFGGLYDREAEHND